MMRSNSGTWGTLIMLKISEVQVKENHKLTVARHKATCITTILGPFYANHTAISGGKPLTCLQQVVRLLCVYWHYHTSCPLNMRHMSIYLGGKKPQYPKYSPLPKKFEATMRVAICGQTKQHCLPGCPHAKQTLTSKMFKTQLAALKVGNKMYKWPTTKKAPTKTSYQKH